MIAIGQQRVAEMTHRCGRAGDVPAGPALVEGTPVIGDVIAETRRGLTVWDRDHAPHDHARHIARGVAVVALQAEISALDHRWAVGRGRAALIEWVEERALPGIRPREPQSR